MDITITISDEKINEIIRDNINGISKEDISAAIIKGIEEQMKSSGETLVRGLLFNNDYQKSLSYFGDAVVKEAAKDVDLTNLENSIIKFIDDNKRDIITEAIMKLFLDNLNNKIDFSRLLYDYKFRESVKNVVRDMQYES